MGCYLTIILYAFLLVLCVKNNHRTKEAFSLISEKQEIM